MQISVVTAYKEVKTYSLEVASNGKIFLSIFKNIHKMVQMLKWVADTCREDHGFIGLLFFLTNEKELKTTLKLSWLQSCFVHWRFQIEIWTSRLAILTEIVRGIPQFSHSFINGSTDLCWALASSSVS
jgi:hypothetical protein